MHSMTHTGESSCHCQVIHPGLNVFIMHKVVEMSHYQYVEKTMIHPSHTLKKTRIHTHTLKLAA